MAANELGRTPILDLTFQNFGATAIAAGLVVLVDAGHVPSSTAIGGVLLPTNGGGVAGTLGVTIDALAALTGVGRVAIMGTAVCTAHGTVTYGQIVMASDTAAHLGHVKTVTAAARQLGLALDTATDGQQVRVALFPAMNA